MRLLQLIGFLLPLAFGVYVDPVYPPNTVSGGTVIAEVHVVAGNVRQIAIRSGEEPFVSAARNALVQWQLPTEDDGDRLVIVHFRQPNLYYLNSAGETISGAEAKKGLPYPRKIIGPSYPAQGVGQGSVVLRANISADGKVEKIEPLKSAGTLTDVSIDAVRKWEFTPAVNNQGAAEPSFAFAVLVYRFPVIEPKK